MKIYKEELGKVSITIEGVHNPAKVYDRLCLVTNGNFGIYISKKIVPGDTSLTNTEYWQCISDLNQDVKIDYNDFKNYITGIIDNLTDYVNSLIPNNLISVNDIIIRAINTLAANGALKFGFTILQKVSDLNNPKYQKIGDFVYVVEDSNYYICKPDKSFYKIPTIYVGDNEPEDTIWFDTQENIGLDANDTEEIAGIKRAITTLQNNVAQLNKLQYIGIIPAGIGGSYRRLMMSYADPEQPEAFVGEVVEEEPDKYEAGSNTSCVCCKVATAKEFAHNKQDLIDGEMIFYSDRKKFGIYYQGKFYMAGDATGGGGGLSEDDLYDINLKYLNFITADNSYYRINVNDVGEVVTKKISDRKWSLTNDSANADIASKDTNGIYISWLLTINSVYCGGAGSDECLCSHNFVELANASNKDINLNGLHLLYTDCTLEEGDAGYKWKVIDLEGVIKAGSTYLIRGARCNKDKESLIVVDSYDQVWIDNNTNKPIEFKQGVATFYLCVGDDYKNEIDNKTLKNPWRANSSTESSRTGYIDSCGFGVGSAGESNASLNPANEYATNWNKLLFVRWFTLEPAKQGNKAYNARKTSALWTYIILDRQTQYKDSIGGSIHYYYDDQLKQLYTPQASYRNKDFFTNKSRFNINKPNYVNVTFGIQATDGGENKRATRCFNWISVGRYNEYIAYRKLGESEWKKVYSITSNNYTNPDWIKNNIQYYDRLNWTASDGTRVTSHKCIIHDLTAGEYEFYIKRDNDNSYNSDIYSFKIKADSEVTSFSIIQISDQQGFNWQEYTAWHKAAKAIKDKENNFDFIINTGDITQSGNRVNEWLDYYEGKKYLIDKEEMFTIGNNDLCGYNSTDLTDGNDASSKYSHINILRYYCFEVNPNNPYNNFTWKEDKTNEDSPTHTSPIYSLYSFNYGKYHFISLNSEIAIASSKMYIGGNDPTFAGNANMAKAANANIENWLIEDLRLWKGENADTDNDYSKAIIYMHEMPFTIVTHAFMADTKDTTARAGSHLNTLNDNGNYRFSRLFKRLGIRLIFGGHKHTYSISKPVYDAPENYIKANNTIDENIDLLGEMPDKISRKPVVQVLNQVPELDPKYANLIRFELVDKITAPYYVMCQATGYKLVSNKELPSENNYRIPWLLSYFASTYTTKAKENCEQHRPTYIKYDFNDNMIVVTPKQIHNIWNVNTIKNSSSFDFNNQLLNVNIKNIGFHTTGDNITTLEADANMYNVSDSDSLTIIL